jgi:hypothetical protein
VKIQLFEVPRPHSFKFFPWRWMKSEVCKEKVNTRDKLVTRIMNSVALKEQEHQDDPRRAIRTIAKRVEN